MKITLKSGATLDITRAPFAVGHKLFKTVLKEMKGVSLELGLKEGQTLGSLFELEITDDALNTVKNGILTLLSSQDIEDVLWECFARVTYNDKKVDRKLFEEDQVAEDYLEISKEVMMVNLAPFQRGLESLFSSVLLKKASGSPKLS